MITIALVGKPNVGKSSLFNRLCKQRDAIISEVSGTTRDVKRRVIEIDDKEALLYDTGGIEDRDEIFDEVKKKSIQAAAEADIVLFMVDGKEYPQEADRKLFFQLQKISKNIALVINKVDNEKMKEMVYEYTSFGAKNVFDISVSHNIGVNNLIKWLSSFIPDTHKIVSSGAENEDDFLDFIDDIDIEEEDEQIIEETNEQEEANKINIAILGRPNVGKSSLLNSLTGTERSVVSPIAGTTIDPVDETIFYNDKELTFVDTAGIRKRGKIEGIEKFALMRSKDMLERSDVALLVLDASEDFTEQDERIAGLIQEYKLACIIVLNKYDKAKAEYKELVDEIRYRYKFLSYAPVITVSALSKKRIHKVNDLILEVFENYCKRIPTSRLNEIIKEATIKHHIPTDKGKVVKFYFAVQYKAKPPQIALISNRPESVHFSYYRYLENRLRESVELTGTPVIIKAKKRKSDEEEQA
ncbi:MAG: GTPase [Campylobacterota bacterium]|nr:GTPase [Campylobacterota bacterium]